MHSSPGDLGLRAVFALACHGSQPITMDDLEAGNTGLSLARTLVAPKLGILVFLVHNYY